MRYLCKLLIGAAVLAAACAGASTPALAAVPGLTRVVETYALDPSLGEYKRASCPEGTGLLSAGYEVIGGGGDTRRYRGFEHAHLGVGDRHGRRGRGESLDRLRRRLGPARHPRLRGRCRGTGWPTRSDRGPGTRRR